MMNGCFCLVFVAWTWQSKAPCCQLQLWCNRPRIRLDPTTGSMQATRQRTSSKRYGVCVCACVWKWFHRFENTPAVHKRRPLQWKAEDVTWGKTQTKESWATHSLRPQNQYGSHMMRNNAIVQRARWRLVPTDTSVEKPNYPELTGATNSGLPQKRQSPCPWPRKSPLESIAAPKLWGERKKERERYLKPTALWSLSTCCRLSDSLASLAQNCFTTRKLLHSFSFLHSHTPCNLPALFQ